MTKILFITTRNPYSGRYSGDVIRALKVINFLRKKNIVDVVYLSKKKNIIQTKKNKRDSFFFYPNIFLKIFYCLSNALKLQPLQFGLFFSQEMSNFIKKNAKNYNLLFFHQIRSSQYLPKDFKGKSVLEMGDLYSDNYFQTYKNLGLLNIFKYIYMIESFLVKKTEIKLLSTFDRIILFSKSEIKKIDNRFKKKIFYITEANDKIKNKYFFSKKNNQILFIGNLGYIPNIMACKDFIINVMPKLKSEIPNIKLNIIGNIKIIDKFIFSFFKNVNILGPQKNLDRHIKNTICGIANLKIATGVQGKILTYMSFGLPVICSKKTASNFGKSVLSYKNNKKLIENICMLKNNKKISQIFSKKSLSCVKKLNWDKIKLDYSKVIKFSKKSF